MKYFIFLALLITSSLTLNSYANEKTSKSEPVTLKTKNDTSTILFFMNPHGRPCQIQDEILSALKEDLKGMVVIQYVKTTEAQDRGKFGQYGIRSLPQLMLLSKDNKVSYRFTPGIHDKEAIKKQIVSTK